MIGMSFANIDSLKASLEELRMTPAAVQADHVDDSSTMEELERQVQGLLGSHVRHFHIVRRGDGLILKGRTHTFYAKQMAQQLVMRGNHRVLANEIEVV